MNLGLYFDLRNPTPRRENSASLYGFKLKMCAYSTHFGAFGPREMEQINYRLAGYFRNVEITAVDAVAAILIAQTQCRSVPLSPAPSPL